MFGVKDLESLKNLSTVLTIPFFVAGYITSEKITFQLDDPVRSIFQVIPNIFAGGCFFVAVFCLLWAFSQIHSFIATSSTILFSLVGLSCLTIGLCQIPTLIVSIGQGISPIHDIFWTLGYISAGFTSISMTGAFSH
ncbi:MAG TPA: hypothetical protein VIH59_15655 [Candidatus Tectomicrobia bacterium]|jgi:hypothetical protein